MTNNFELIKPLLVYPNEGDFYEVLITARKKDQPEENKEQFPSTRTIKSYIIESNEKLDLYKDEIITICEALKARAYISLRKYNHNEVNKQLPIKLAERNKQKSIRNHDLFWKTLDDSVYQNLYWMLDFDYKDTNLLDQVEKLLEKQQPEGTKVVQVLPTKAGYHIITKKFRRDNFFRDLKEINMELDFNKKGTTALYLPSTIDY